MNYVSAFVDATEAHPTLSLIIIFLWFAIFWYFFTEEFNKQVIKQ